MSAEQAWTRGIVQGTLLSWKQHEWPSSVVELLLDYTANPDSSDGSRKTSLYLAAENGASEVVALLLERATCVGTEDSEERASLMAASCGDHVRVINILMQNKACIHLRANDGSTALHFGARYGHLIACRTLLACGADINTGDVNGVTPLMTAIGKRHLDIVELLLTKNADVAAETKEGKTAMILAVEEGALEIIKQLLERPDGNNLLDGGAVTPLMAAAGAGQTSVVGFLLQKKANVYTKAADGSTASHFAAAYGHLDSCRLPLDGGACIDAGDSYRKTPLAVIGCHAEVVNFLL